MFELIDMLIVRPIVNILFVIYGLVGDFGLAIILFTIIVKFLMWPLVKRQLHQTKLMRKIQPELAEIKKNCNGNRQMESLQMMDLYKRYNIKPFRSFTTLLIQLPIFIGLFAAINAIVRPQVGTGSTCGYTNVSYCVYEPVRGMERIQDIINKQDAYFSAAEAKQKDANAPDPVYEFQPKLFGLADLNARAGFSSLSSIIVLLFALIAALIQYYMAKQQMPSGKSEKSRSFRKIVKEAAASGKEPDQAELNAIVSNQMSFMMPLMMLMIMINLPGVLVFYYMLTNAITVVQQKIVLAKSSEDMEVSADKAVLKELKNIKEAEVIENKKTGTRITRISAKDRKKGGKRKSK